MIGFLDRELLEMIKRLYRYLKESTYFPEYHFWKNCIVQIFILMSYFFLLLQHLKENCVLWMSKFHFVIRICKKKMKMSGKENYLSKNVICSASVFLSTSCIF